MGAASGMDPVSLMLLSGGDPSLIKQQMQLQRQQALANALLEGGSQQASQTPQMSGGVLVGASPISHLTGALQEGLGAYLGNRAIQGQADMYGRMLGPQTAPGTAPQAQAGTGQPQGAPSMQGQPQGPEPQMGASGGLIDIPGMSHQQSMLLYLSDKPAWAKAFSDGHSFTPEQKNAFFASGGDPNVAQSIVSAGVRKAGSIDLRDMGSAMIPTYDPKNPYMRIYGPNETSNIQYTQGPNGQMIAQPIQGGAEAAAGYAGAIERAKELNKVLPDVQTSTGAHVPMFAGQAIGANGPSAPSSAPAFPGAAPPSPTMPQPMLDKILSAKGVDKAIAEAPDEATARALADRFEQIHGVGQYAPGNPPGAPPQIGQTTAQHTLQEQTGESAANNARVQATTQNLVSQIDAALKLNPNVPTGLGVGPETKAEIDRRLGSYSPFPGAAKGEVAWNQLIGSQILSGLKTLQGMGRVDLPEVREVIKTYGLGQDNPVSVRADGLMRLKQLILNNAATSQNAMANLNQPGATTTIQRIPIAAPTGAQPSAPRVRRYNPATGQIE